MSEKEAQYERQVFDAAKFMSDRRMIESGFEDAMIHNADLLGFYGFQQALWKTFHDLLKLSQDNLAAKIEVDIKAEGEKVTESTVKAKVQLNSEVQSLKRKIILAGQQEKLYSNAVAAIDQRGKMATSIGAWKRAEMQGLGATHTGSGTDMSPTSGRLSDSDRASLQERLRAAKRLSQDASDDED